MNTFLKGNTDGQQIHENMHNMFSHQRNASQTIMRFYFTTVRMISERK